VTVLVVEPPGQKMPGEHACGELPAGQKKPGGQGTELFVEPAGQKMPALHPVQATVAMVEEKVPPGHWRHEVVAPTKE
jgi:hypothetical protein